MQGRNARKAVWGLLALGALSVAVSAGAQTLDAATDHTIALVVKEDRQ